MPRGKILTALLLFSLSIHPALADQIELNEMWIPTSGSQNIPVQNLVGFQLEDDSFGQRAVSQVFPSTGYDFCDSLGSGSCAVVGSNAQIFLPVCSIDDEKLCIEYLQIKSSSDSSFAPLKFMRYVDTKKLPAQEKLGIQEGFGLSVWGDDEKTYGVGVMIDYRTCNSNFYSCKNGIVINRLQAEIIPASISPMSGARPVGWQRTSNNTGIGLGYLDSRNNFKSMGNCAWLEVDLCASRKSFDYSSQFKISIRVPVELSGWLYGRLSEATIESSPIGSEVSRLVVTGKPVLVPFSGWIGDWTTLPAESKTFIRSVGSAPDGKTFFSFPGIVNSNSWAIKWLDAFSSKLDNKAAAIKSRWSFASSINMNYSPCFANNPGLDGMVTTNAMIYQSSAPEFVNQELQYQLAGLHFNPDGSIFNGLYELSINSGVARCLYGFSSAPIRASVSITNENEIRNVKTEVIGEKDGWFKLGAYGITFSAPKVSVKFEQDTKVEITPSPTPVATSPTSKGSTLKKTISCKRGKVIKKITGVNPKCPQGYVKLSAP